MSLFGHVYSNEGSSAQQLITWVPHCREGCKRKSYTLWSRLDLLGVDQPSWQAFEEKRNRILGAPFALSSCPKIPFPSLWNICLAALLASTGSKSSAFQIRMVCIFSIASKVFSLLFVVDLFYRPVPWSSTFFLDVI